MIILEYFLVFLRKICSVYSLEGASNEYPQHIDFFSRNITTKFCRINIHVLFYTPPHDSGRV